MEAYINENYQGPTPLTKQLSDLPHLTFDMHKFEVSPESTMDDWQHYAQTLGVIGGLLIAVVLLWFLIETIVRLCVWCSTKRPSMSTRQCRCRLAFTLLFILTVLLGCCVMVLASVHMSSSISTIHDSIQDAKEYQDTLRMNGNSALSCADQSLTLLNVLMRNPNITHSIKESVRPVITYVKSFQTQTGDFLSSTNNYQGTINDVLQHINDAKTYQTQGVVGVCGLLLIILLVLLAVNGFCCLCCRDRCLCCWSLESTSYLHRNVIHQPSHLHVVLSPTASAASASGGYLSDPISMHDHHSALLTQSGSASFSSSQQPLLPPLSSSSSFSAYAYAPGGGGGGGGGGGLSSQQQQQAPAPRVSNSSSATCCRCVCACCVHTWTVVVFLLVVIVAGVLLGASVAVSDVCQQPDAYIQYAQMKYVASGTTANELMTYYLFCAEVNPLLGPVTDALNRLNQTAGGVAAVELEVGLFAPQYDWLVEQLQGNLTLATEVLYNTLDILPCDRIHQDYSSLENNVCIQFENNLVIIYGMAVMCVVMIALIRCCVPPRDRIPLRSAQGDDAYVHDPTLTMMEGQMPDELYAYDYAAVNNDGSQIQNNGNAAAAASMTHSRFGNGDSRTPGMLPGNYAQVRAFDGFQPEPPPPQYEEPQPPPLFSPLNSQSSDNNNNNNNNNSNNYGMYVAAPAEAIALSTVNNNNYSNSSSSQYRSSSTPPMSVSGGGKRRSGSTSPLVPRSPHRRGGGGPIPISGGGGSGSYSRTSSSHDMHAINGEDDEDGNNVDWDSVAGRSRAGGSLSADNNNSAYHHGASSRSRGRTTYGESATTEGNPDPGTEEGEPEN